jgi:hypothetical protein
VVTTVAGTGQFTPLKNTIGVASTFYYPFYLAIDRSGNIFVSDQYNNVIRKIYNYDIGNFSLYTSGDVFTDSSLYAKNIVVTNSLEVSGYLTIGGAVTFKTDRWNGSSDGALRLYFGNNSSSYYQSRAQHVFRHASNSGPPYGERNVFTIDGNWGDQGTLALSCAAGNRGTFTHYYCQSTLAGVNQDSYELWWYPSQGQGGLGGSGTTLQVWNLNAAQNYWNVNIPMNLGRDLRVAGNLTAVGEINVTGRINGFIYCRNFNFTTPANGGNISLTSYTFPNGGWYLVRADMSFFRSGNSFDGIQLYIDGGGSYNLSYLQGFANNVLDLGGSAQTGVSALAQRTDSAVALVYGYFDLRLKSGTDDYWNGNVIVTAHPITFI